MRLLAATVGAFLALSGQALAAGGPAIPTGAYGGVGVTGAPDTPASEFRYVAGDGGGGASVVAKVKRGNGNVPQFGWFDGNWALPAVTIMGDAGGLSADGGTLVLTKPVYRMRLRSLRLRILNTRRLQTVDRLTLDGAFSFDAISPDGRSLYLVQYRDPRDPFDYRVRRFDLRTNRLAPGAIVDPDEPGERMTGQPASRRMSPDGVWAYTLYGGGDATFIHALDTERGVAQCIDLEGLEARDLFKLDLRVDGSTGEITVTKNGDPVATVDPRTFEVSAVDPSAPPSGDSGDGSGVDWLGASAVAGGLVLLAAAGGLLLRRRRRTAA